MTGPSHRERGRLQRSRANETWLRHSRRCGASAARASQIGIHRAILGSVSTQIAVRLPDEMVAFLDRAVALGKAPSRAALVASAVEREMRRLAAEQDAQLLRAHGASDDLDDLVEWTASHAIVEE